MIPLESARDQILSALAPLPPEEVPLAHALGRVPTDPYPATVDLPPFDNASVDGYAIRAVDVAAAAPERPVRLRVVETAAAGAPPGTPVTPGTCARIFTGAMLPEGADAVVMQEDTLRDGPEGTIDIRESARPWENVRFAGEDVRRGTELTAPGRPLTASRLSLLAAGGHARLRVHRRPRLALISTGNELVPPGAPLTPGTLYDSNGPLLAALAASAGAEVVHQSRIADHLEDCVRAFQEAAGKDRADVLVTTGGVSVGDADHLKPAMTAAGGTVHLWRIAMKPGKPFTWGRLGPCHWFGLPGNPVSAFVTWFQLVRPALRRLQGFAEVLDPTVPAILAEPVSNPGSRRHFLRVWVDPQGSAHPVGGQASHMLSGLAAANALLEVPPESRLDAGTQVRVEWLG